LRIGGRSASWGMPMRAEDLDTVTGGAPLRRRPTRGLPGRLADGTPRLPGTRPTAARSRLCPRMPTGRTPRRSMQTAEPSMASEPTWLADGQTFSRHRAKHMGCFPGGG
jgi:hypothetical protein